MVESSFMRHLVLARKECYNDVIRAAERERLVWQGSDSTRHYVHCRALAWLGRTLVVCGWRLQRRYGTTATLPARLIV